MGKKTQEKAHRAQAEILSEYGRVCAEIGDLSYRLSTAIPARLDELYALARQLNLENAAAMAATQESKPDGN